MIGSENPTILIVDDEPTNLSVLNQILSPFYRIRAANSGQRALQVAASDPSPDLILLDVMMPQLDGYQVLAQLQQTAATAEIPVIFVTALGDESDEERGLKLGAVDYISKPIKQSIVLARVRNHLELKQSRDRLKSQNAWLESEVERRLHEIQLIQDVSLCALAELAETRDNETGNHILRTQAFVELLARQLRKNGPYQDELNSYQIGLITKAAPLHDIGKVGIPDSILLKPGRLSQEEFEIMKTHARIGGEAIDHAMSKAILVQGNSEDELAKEPLEFLKTAQVIATSHHERWDGAGYPDGLATTDIPLAARIMAVADVFDALINRRVYKPAMSVEKASAIIRDGSGSQFDPEVVNAFFESLSDFETVAKRFADAKRLTDADN